VIKSDHVDLPHHFELAYVALKSLAGLKRVVLRDLDDMDYEEMEGVIETVRRLAGKDGLEVEIQNVC
jgi:hypothetical protein